MIHNHRHIVIGSKGFIGRQIVRELEADGHKSISLTRRDIDLGNKSTLLKLRQLIRPESILVFAAAKVPAKTEPILRENIEMISNLIEVIGDMEFSYLLNVSSDAVYPDLTEEINETTQIAPTSIHGLMHAERERILNYLRVPVGHIRPTLVYGALDPHRGYGPNQFVRLALSGLPIKLFGGGEELRDHVEIRDVGSIARSMILNKYVGPINAVSGELYSFRQIADVVSRFIPNTKIEFLPRSAPMPHNGYRAFSLNRILELLPNYKALDLEIGLANMICELQEQNGRN